jgi:hypothetical protein
MYCCICPCKPGEMSEEEKKQAEQELKEKREMKEERER